jgi:hypothetical protein
MFITYLVLSVAGLIGSMIAWDDLKEMPRQTDEV